MGLVTVIQDSLTIWTSLHPVWGEQFVLDFLGLFLILHSLKAPHPQNFLSPGKICVVGLIILIANSLESHSGISFKI